jgi:hypothetical protein
MREYKSVKNWFSVREYEKQTEITYIGYIATFCGLLGRNPDELVNVTSEEALKMQQRLATLMKEELGLREYSITQRINALHSFWRSNGVQVTDDIMHYRGTPWLKRKRRIE